MPKKPASSRAPRLAITYIVWTTLFGLLLMGGLGLLAKRHLDAFEEASLAEAVSARGRGLATAFMRPLYQQWLELKTVADTAGNPRRAPALQSELSGLTEGESSILWAGYADLEGLVEAASDGLLVKESVAGRPWFSQGLEGPYAGDPHEAVLLAERLDSGGDEPLRFLDLAMPVVDDARRVRGVIGAHIDVDKTTEYLRELSDALSIDAFLISQTGAVLIAPADWTGGTMEMPGLRAAQLGASRPYVETSPDGRFMTAVLGGIGYQDLPSFGWSLLVRMPMELPGTARADLIRSFVIAGVIALLVLFVLAFAYIQLYLRPISRLTDSAVKVAEGDPSYPYESRRTREASELSGALGLIQSRLERP